MDREKRLDGDDDTRMNLHGMGVYIIFHCKCFFCDMNVKTFLTLSMALTEFARDWRGRVLRISLYLYNKSLLALIQ